jgi:hypothetical protein
MFVAITQHPNQLEHGKKRPYLQHLGYVMGEILG